MRICFTSDLHGDGRLYDQLDVLLREDTPDLLILGGDIVADGSDDDPVGSQLKYVAEEFIPRIAKWRGELSGLVVACLVGNHEWLPTRDALRAGHERGELVLLSTTPFEMRDVRFVGYGCTPPTPHSVKDFERRDVAEDGVPEFSGVVWDAAHGRSCDADFVDHFMQQPSVQEELAGLPPVASPWIFVAHAPPFGTKLDRLPGLTYPIGSRGVREFIEARQPLCALHGHVHDSAEVTGVFMERIGETLCINPGQGDEQLHAVLLDTAAPEQTIRHTVYA